MDKMPFLIILGKTTVTISSDQAWRDDFSWRTRQTQA
jgi:hypothetical protein